MMPSYRDKIIDRDQLAAIRLRHAQERVVLCAGCFDVLHAGHAVFINQCAELGDVLVAGVARDSTIRMLKGPKRPVNPEQNRLYLIANLGAVDYALLTDDPRQGSDVRDILCLLRPDIFAVTEADAWAIDAESALCEQVQISMVRLPRTVPQGLTLSSTTEIVNKLLDS